MEITSARPPSGMESLVNTYGNLLFRISFVMLGNKNDAEDAVQDTMLRYLQKAPPFVSTEHEKAWLIKVAANRCRDVQRFWHKHPQLNVEELSEIAPDLESCGIMEALMMIPEKFRIVMTLYYVEEYPIKDISHIIGRSSSAVKMRLQKGRRLLEETYRKEFL